MIQYIIAGFMAGVHRASWGAFKDSPYEGFEIKKYLRSILVGVIWSIGLFYWFRSISTMAPLLFIFLMVVLFDTLTVEIFKLFFRVEDQKKYKIPSRIHWWNVEVKTEWQRNLVGMIFIGAIFFIFRSLFKFHLSNDLNSRLMAGMMFGFVAGLCEAMGGMWKDAPFEGFEPLKFFRSPLVGSVAGGFLSLFQTNLGVLVLATFGADRMLIESYKTFVLRRRSGKFLSKKPLFARELEMRKYLVAPYLSTWAYLLLIFRF